jgi:peptide/nickel transport system permease protein
MWRYIALRLGYMMFTLFVISILAFTVIQLPPGDYIDHLLRQMASESAPPPPEVERQMRALYGFDQPIYVQYFKWLGNIITRGEFGYSFVYRADAREIIFDRLPMSFAVAFGAFLVVQLVSIPIGIYSAVRQYSIGDYIFTFLGFIGRAVPNFLLALLLLYITYTYFGTSLIGLFSSQYVDAPWSWGKLADLLKHLWIPAIVIGLDRGAAQIRTMRANLLDELNKPYVDTARAKGLPETRLLWKYPVRHAANPIVSTVGWSLPEFISGEAIVSIVLNLPTAGPIFLASLFSQDMYVAAGFILMFSVLTVIGTFISDLLLVWLDPRLRLQ